MKGKKTESRTMEARMEFKNDKWHYFGLRSLGWISWKLLCWTLFSDLQCLNRSSIFTTADSQQLPPTNRSMKSDCVLTHTVMSSTCARLLPFCLPILHPPLCLPLSHLPHSSSLLSPLFFFAYHLLSFSVTIIIISPFTHTNNRCVIVGFHRMKWVAAALVIRTFCFPSFTGEGEEVHAPSGQPKGPRRGEELHVQQTHILHF